MRRFATLPLMHQPGEKWMYPTAFSVLGVLLARAAGHAGGATYNEPQDHGFMYGHGFQDLDGHIWELIYMEPSAVKPN